MILHALSKAIHTVAFGSQAIILIQTARTAKKGNDAGMALHSCGKAVN
jgi:hypothetical protein